MHVIAERKLLTCYRGKGHIRKRCPLDIAKDDIMKEVSENESTVVM